MGESLLPYPPRCFRKPISIILRYAKSMDGRQERLFAVRNNPRHIILVYQRFTV